MKNAMQLTALIALALAISSTALATQGVSPGATDRMAVVNNECPTFSWEAGENAALYEIVAYAIHENDDPATSELTAETEALYGRISGAATSWTPSAEQCFAAGGRYVWFVRAVIDVVGDQVIEAGEWSEGRYFAVPAGPTEDEVARAVGVLKRWESVNGGGSLMLSSAAVPDAAAVSDVDAGNDAGSTAPKSVPTASAAIRGEHPDTTGEVFGVVGTSASAAGAGVAAANLGGGADLVLDGSANGQTDTLLSEEGIDRPSAANEVFRFRNTGPGFMNVHVDGEVSASQIKGDELWVASGMVVDDEGNWQGAGDTVPCDGCVDAGDIADGQVDITKLSAQGSGSGQVLQSTGAGVIWADDEIDLPFYGTANSSNPVLKIGNWGGAAGWAIHAEAEANNAIVGDTMGNGSGVLGRNLSTSSGIGVAGQTSANSGIGVWGSGGTDAPEATGVSGVSESGVGVAGDSETGAGVLGTSFNVAGVQGEVEWGHGVYGISRGYHISGSGPAAGVHGVIDESGYTGVGVLGERDSNWGALGTYYAGVESSAASGHGVIARSVGNGVGNAALWAVSEGGDGIAIRASNDSSDATIVGGNAGHGELIKLFNGNNLRFRVTYQGDVAIDGGYFTGGADFAELLPAFSVDLEPGDVLAIAADGRLMRSQRAYQASVVGVYSTKPGILGGSGIDGDTEGKVPLAVVGVVPVKASDENGPVRPGDMLVASSIPGHAMSAGERAPNGCVIGKALSGLEEGEGVITMLVILQ